MDFSNLILNYVTDFANKVLFFNVTGSDKFQLPFLIFWICSFGIYYSIRFKLINFTMFFTSIRLALSSKINKRQLQKSSEYELSSSRKILLTSIGEAIDVSAIFGVSLAVIVAGPGVLFWMFIGCFLGMPLKFIEISLGCMTRKFDHKNMKVIGGPQRYIQVMFRVIKKRRLGSFVSKFFAICVIISTLFSLQINQTIGIARHILPSTVRGHEIIFSIILAIIVMFIIISGFKSITNIASRIVKVMSILYISTCASIIYKYSDNLIPSLNIIMTDAFSFKAISGSLIFSAITGIKRTFFSCDVGQGLSSLIHVNTINKNPIQEGIIAMSGLIFITMIAVFCSGLVVVITGTYLTTESPMDAVIFAFNSINPIMKYSLFVIVPMFALTTAAAWGYFGQSAWRFLFGNSKNSVIYYNILLFSAYIVCGCTEDFGTILNLADIFNFSISIPNLIAVSIGTKFVWARFTKEMKNKRLLNA